MALSRIDYINPPTAGDNARYNPGLHLIAWLTASATFPLIWMGGLVTSHGAGMSVPDWPNSYGYNMFLFPPNQWVGGIFYEHTHRLMGTVVGMLAIALAVWAWRVEQRRWARNLAYAVLGAVILQGVLGGLRVIWVKLDLAIVHGCVAQAFFCLSALMAIVTSRYWIQPAVRIDSKSAESGRALVHLGLIALAVIYVQLIVGAIMRHYEAGLAMLLNEPLRYDNLLPPFTIAGLKALNHHRAWTTSAEQAAVQAATRPVTMLQTWLHFAHRSGAVLVCLALVPLLVRALRRHRNVPALMWPAVFLALFLITQVTLGILTVVWFKPADIASLHVAFGALTLVTTFVLTVRAMRTYGNVQAIG